MGVQAIASAPTYADQVDGLRFILRQLSYREEQEIEFPASEQPELFYPESPTRKVFADCPDTIYRQFNVHPDHTYRLTGTRGDSAYISFTAYRAAATERVVADLHDGEIEIAANVALELIVGGPAQSSNWLDLGDDGAFVIIREYRHDRAGGAHASPTQTLLETTGRKSGRPRRTPIGGQLDSNRLWLVSEFGERSQYVRNIQSDPRVRIRVGGCWHAGTAHLLPEDDVNTRLAALPRLNSVMVRAMGDNLLTIRIDLDE